MERKQKIPSICCNVYLWSLEQCWFRQNKQTNQSKNDKRRHSPLFREPILKNLHKINVLTTNYKIRRDYEVLFNNQYDNILSERHNKFLAIAGDIENIVIKLDNLRAEIYGRKGLNDTKIRTLINNFYKGIV